jgi:hypothetical protein
MQTPSSAETLLPRDRGRRTHVTGLPPDLQHKEWKPVPPSQRTELEIPDALDELILACLEKIPENRPQTADTVAARLMAIETTAVWTPERAGQWWDVHHPPRSNWGR